VNTHLKVAMKNGVGFSGLKIEVQVFFGKKRIKRYFRMALYKAQNQAKIK
jgi:hypothetical protein